MDAVTRALTGPSGGCDDNTVPSLAGPDGSESAVINWEVCGRNNSMLFEVGETVVYPHHGAATITEVMKRTLKGEEKLYLTLNVTQGDLPIRGPAENVDLVGVRDVIGKDGLDKV